MKSVEHVEKALERLVPAALSAQAGRSLEELLDELAGTAESPAPEVSAIPVPMPDRRRRPWFGLGAAAAVAAGGLVALWAWPNGLEEIRPSSVAITPAAKPLQLIREVSRVESAVDEGTLDDAAGGIHRVLRYRVVGE